MSSDENGFVNEPDTIWLQSTRPPLNSIPDPSQLRQDTTPRVSKSLVLSTPPRSVSKSVSSRASFYNGSGKGNCSRVLRGQCGNEMSVEIPHFEMEEDPSFWNEHNVQVVIRIRPISSLESVSQGNGRCLKQESAQSLLWLGHPETRFTFDHVACETISQEKLFKVAGLPMVENCMSGYNSCMFAFGQTGSGKTYTMMGDIQEMEGKLNEDSGITPRIFEHLFSRISMEETKRKDEKLKYCCKCSFLEIYNEQITDLLEPSSINLQLREDFKKGVYVENLTERSVTTVTDVIELLIQGSTNRRVASTHMNSESSRSHSVFTCTIESCWEKDSLTHLRFGRLNLVDLAGSERQKTSGAEGDRLKEAANINKSLSTLGMVIMSLVDMAQGKQRHVPYRDSRLTFLLQDSLGGNSKTMIIANVSPSICSANETFSTLKFAQRAKLIQNNAKVNEDASGDVSTLQRQVHMLKDQLSLLIKHHSQPKSLTCPVNFLEEPHMEFNSSGDRLANDSHTDVINVQRKKIACLDASLIGALRREKQAEAVARKLEAEIEHLNRLVQERDEDAQRSKMMMRFREEKIKRLEMLIDGSLSEEKCRPEENDALVKEIQTLQAKIDRNPEVTRFALENIRLLDHLQQYQNFYENGEREKLQTEISNLRDQLFDSLNLIKSSENELQADHCSAKAIKECKDMNSRLMREFTSIQNELERDDSDKAALNPIQGDDNSSLNVEQKCNRESVHASDQEAVITAQQNKLNVMSKELERVIQIHSQYQESNESELYRKNQVERDVVLEQVEIETAETIIHLQEEVATLQSELQDQLSCMAHENMVLRNKLAAKDFEMKELTMKWERATLELTSFLIDGCQSLSDVSAQIEEIAYSFPKIDGWISAQVMKAAKVCIKKEEIILSLRRNLEDAQNFVQEIEMKISSLKEASLARNADDKYEAHEGDNKVLQQVRFELLETNQKLGIIGSNLKSISNMYNNRVNTEPLELGECSTDSDYSSSSSESSAAHIGSDTEKRCPPEFVKEDPDLNFTGASSFLSPMRESNSSKMHLQKSVQNEMITFGLERELRQTKEAFKKLSTILAVRLDVEGGVKILPCTGTKRKRARTCLNIDKCSSPSSMWLHAEIEKDSTISFLNKFEEVQSTIKEADMMLNALVNANEKSKQLTNLWKQAGKDLMLEKSHLLDEVAQLKHSAAVQEKENVLIQEELQRSYLELGSLVTVLETSFKEMHLDMEEQIMVMYSDVSSMVQDLLSCVNGLRPLYGKYLMDKKLMLSTPPHGHNDDQVKRNINQVECAVEDYQTVVTSNSDLMNKSAYQSVSAVHKSTFDKYSAKGDHGDVVQENDLLKDEIDRKDGVLNGLLFDFSLLQESASHAQDMRNENQKLDSNLNSIQKELESKTKQLCDLQVEQERNKMQLAKNEKSLSQMSYDLEQATEMIEILSAQNAELGTLVEELYTKKSETEEQLDEQKELARNLENEVIRLSNSTDIKLFSSIGSVDDELREAIDEKSKLIKEIEHLKNKASMAYALADENEALVIEARQESEASKIYAEEKEEEVRILEHSVEELERTVNILEKKVYEMDDEVKRNKIIKDSLELEVQALRQRILTVETLTGSTDPEQLVDNLSNDHTWRDLHDKSLEFQEARNRITFLEGERSRQDVEIKQLKEYISEIVVHAEAQASQYQQKYKALEGMVCGIKKEPSNYVSTMSTMDRTEKVSTRTRGSSSPFRCISSLVQQMNTEKDQELSVARRRIEELEALYSKQKMEVCTLNSRLAAAESMTHDVIRDLLGVKLDITNYANIIDQHQVHQLLEVAHQQTEQAVGKEQEILILRKQVDDLTEERESLISESKQRRADMLTAQMTLEQLREHEQWLSAQNKMLKMDKINLKRKVAELGDTVKRLLSEHNSQLTVQQPTKFRQLRGSTSSEFEDVNFAKSLTKSEKTLSRVNDELAQYRRMTANHLQRHDRTDRHNTDTKYRN